MNLLILLLLTITQRVLLSNASPIIQERQLPVFPTITVTTTTPTTTTSSGVVPSDSSSASSTGTTNPNSSLFNGISPLVLDYVAAAIVLSIILTLLIARYHFIKRYYPVSPRAFFVPVRGVHLKWLGIHVNGPPPRPVHSSLGAGGGSTFGSSGAAGSYYFVRGPDGVLVRRRRRDRTARGVGIGEGGEREGERDEDDLFDNEGGGCRSTEERERLPEYRAKDTDLPPYKEEEEEEVRVEDVEAQGGPASDASELDRGTRSASSSSSSTVVDPPRSSSPTTHVDADRQVPTYPPMAYLGTSGPTLYPPPARGHGQTTTTTTTISLGDEEQLPSVQEYEAQSRARMGR
ncbi:hypothetical protein T439DRAFT_328499 [Meredithblackwellia eburnea MCA 4105]